MSKPTPLLAALALAAVLIPAAALRAGQAQSTQAQSSQAQSSQAQASPAQSGQTRAAPAPANLAPTASPARPLLNVQGAGVVAVPPGATETSAVMILRNPGAQPVVLTGAQTAVAGHAMLMTTRRDAQGRSGMSAVKTLTVPARGTLRLEPSGDHLMLMGLKRTLKVGETVRLTLRVRGGPPLVVNAVVRKP
ncbi:copper chaperone PCu(A)C [Deinococcus budaensis]|uniref:Copper chaperone PCu(A)C n=1 Tax=Deinococcus budaensis TaxID=1665626 RepID=A0A7W8GGM1_9DEIO|nr:copper chaperone PCu(A)C [Deinococcus budaensis]MBB5235260.1 hypothetical protein [Deinococcus budaensis]